MADFVPCAGALRYFNSELGEWVHANPHDPLYSTVTMLASHYWRDDRWVAIFDHSEGDAYVE